MTAPSKDPQSPSHQLTSTQPQRSPRHPSNSPLPLPHSTVFQVASPLHPAAHLPLSTSSPSAKRHTEASTIIFT